MKTLLLVLFFTFVGVSLSSKYTEDILLPSDKECLKELGMDSQLLFNNLSDDLLVTEGNGQLNEFHECSYRKMNVVDENNEIHYDLIKPIIAPYIGMLNKNIDQEKVANDAVESCKSVEGNSIGDRLVKLDNCVFKKAKNII